MNELSVVVTQGKIEVLHFAELKSEIAERASHYQTLVIDEKEQAAAVTDRANLRKLAKTLNDERIAKEREYLSPWNNAKAQIDELIGLLKPAIENIDTQLKAFEQAENDKKTLAIAQLWESKHFNLMPYSKVYDPRWLNKGFDFEDISKAMDDFIAKANSDFDIIEKLLGSENDEAINEAWSIYKEASKLDAAEALAEQKRRSEARKLADTQRNALKAQTSLESPKTEQIKETAPEAKPAEPLETYCLAITGTRNQLQGLRQFLADSKMTYKKI